MRCPKCDYISFDRQRTCSKCGNDLTAVEEQLKGTVGNVAAPFFLAGILARQKTAVAEPAQVIQEEEEVPVLIDMDTEESPVDEEELDSAGLPLDEADLEDQPLPPLGLEQIDFSDLVPPQEEEEESVLSMESEPEETFPGQDEVKPLEGIEFPGLEPEASANQAEELLPIDNLDHESPESLDNEEDEWIVDLSSLMDFEETPSQSSTTENVMDLFDLSQGKEPKNNQNSD